MLVTKLGVFTRVARMLVVTGLAALGFQSTTAFAQTTPACGPEVKDAIARRLASVENSPEAQKLAVEEEIYKQYQYCAQDAKFVSATFFAAARQCGAGVSNLGSLFYEEMSCVGYDPQRRQFAAPVKIKQTFGFGFAPLPGSREHVLHCVADFAGVLQPVGRDSVHLSNALPGQAPTWQFAVITNANENLQTIQPMNNQTRNARSILSWALPPTSCNYVPIWGNALNYRIRLDQ
ncbi:MAG: hypothetical protein H7039_11365 [Bryobacteraceae bacterium]|nr:hypothetical protein [Bryobacteraceae bacterium]